MYCVGSSGYCRRLEKVRLPMCLAVPMKIVELLPDKVGVAELEGSRQEVNLSLVPDAGVGSYVIVHAGFAIERMNEHEADEILAVFAEMAASGM